MGLTLAPPTATRLLQTGIYIYAIVGIVTAIVYISNPDETPGSIAALALAVVGAAAAIVTNAYRAILPGTGGTPPQPPPPQAQS
jgi:hypothetical protein